MESASRVMATRMTGWQAGGLRRHMTPRSMDAEARLGRRVIGCLTGAKLLRSADQRELPPPESENRGSPGCFVLGRLASGRYGVRHDRASVGWPAGVPFGGAV